MTSVTIPHMRHEAGTQACLRVFALGVLLLAATSASAQSGENVLLVINSSSAASEQIGDHYARVRGVPSDNVLRLALEATDQIARPAFERQILAPIATWLNRRSAQDRILYIVLTKGVPLRIEGTGGRSGTVASVDSELALLYRRIVGVPVPLEGPVANPYFLGDREVGDARPFTHETQDIYLVARLDGYTVADVIALIDRGLSPARTGRIVLDEKVALVNDSGNRWLERSAARLNDLAFGDRVLVESTSRIVSGEADLLGYYSWGSNDPALKARDLTLTFVPGAVAGMYVSTDARTFKEPPAAWTFGRWEDPRTFFEGSPQSLTGDLIRLGVTGVAGHVAEPYLDTTIRPDILFPAYVSGFNLVESYYLAMPALSWQTVVVGDPLCAPFRKQPLAARDIDPGADAETEFPRFFSTRVMQAVAGSSAVRDAVRLVVRAHSRLSRDDRPGAREAFEQATTLDPRMVNAHMMLASLYELAGQPDQAIERYRRMLTVAPNHAVALNNLAYSLAVHYPDKVQEAMALARKAYASASGDPSVVDTLAWILHLSGDDAEARRLIAGATRSAPNNAQIQLHAAIIDAAAGAYDLAARELARAVEIDPQLETQPDVRALRTKLGRPATP